MLQMKLDRINFMRGNLENLAFQFCVCVLNCVWLSATPWTIARQAPLSMEFSSYEYWSGLQLPTPGDLSDPGIKPRSPALAGVFFTTEPPGKPSVL